MILALEEAKYRLENFRADIKELGSALRIDWLRSRVKELEASTNDAAFWKDQENSGKVLREIKRTKDRIAKYEALAAKLEDTVTLAELAIEENDESLVPEVEEAEKEIRAEEESQRIEILLSGEYDQNNAILSFHPGAAGVFSQSLSITLAQRSRNSRSPSFPFTSWEAATMGIHCWTYWRAVSLLRQNRSRYFAASYSSPCRLNSR